MSKQEGDKDGERFEGNLKASGKDIESVDTTIFDQKFNMRLAGEFNSKNAAARQKEKDIQEIKRELARKNDTLVKQYMRDMYDKPVTLSEDRLTQHLVEVAAQNMDAKTLEKVAGAMNPKISQLMVDSIIKKGDTDRMRRKYGPTIAALARGKLGVDLYFILFAVFGIFAIPAYYLYKQKRVKDFMRENDISPISVTDLELAENKGIDLDDISKHVTYYDQSEFKERMLKKLKISKEKEELSEDLYGPVQRAKEEYLFGTKKQQQQKASPGDASFRGVPNSRDARST
jgi:hypothetical protein